MNIRINWGLDIANENMPNVGSCDYYLYTHEKKIYNTKKLKVTFSTEVTAWKVSKCRGFSDPYFPVFGLNTEKYGPGKPPYFNIFHAVSQTAALALELSRILQEIKYSWMSRIFKSVVLSNS